MREALAETQAQLESLREAAAKADELADEIEVLRCAGEQLGAELEDARGSLQEALDAVGRVGSARAGGEAARAAELGRRSSPTARWRARKRQRARSRLTEGELAAHEELATLREQAADAGGAVARLEAAEKQRDEAR